MVAAPVPSVRHAPLARCVDPCQDEGWADLARRSGSLFESPPWLRAIRDSMGVSPTALVCDGPDGPEAGMVSGIVDDAVGVRRNTFPFSDYCGPLGVEDRSTWDRLVGPWCAEPVPWVVRARAGGHAADDPRFVERARFAWHAVELESDAADRWHAIAPAARQNVRRARRSDVQITVDSSIDAVMEFHGLHRSLRRSKYRMLAQPPCYFEALHAAFGPDELAVLTARHDGSPIAGVFLLRWADTAYYKFNASIPPASPLRANDLVMWEAIEFAARTWGARRLDLGLSDLDQPGLLRYKSKFATESGALVAYSAAGEADGTSFKARRLVATIAEQLASDPATTDDQLDRGATLLYPHFC